MKYLLMMLLLVSCQHEQKKDDSTQVIAPPVVAPNPDPVIPVPTPIVLARPVIGWPQDYVNHLDKELRGDFLSLTAIKTNDYCPKWESLSVEDRIQYWKDLWYAIAMAESSHNRWSMYWEKAMDKIDVITGYPIYSEGLLQLSYSDARWYGGRCNAISFPPDKELFIKDVEANVGIMSFKAKADRTILDPYINLSCGLEIAKKLVYKHEVFSYAMGRYWSTMRPGSSGQARVMKAMRFTKCQ